MANKKKVLVIRMLGFGDVTCIGIPALRYLKNQHPDREFHFLTFAGGRELIQLAEPDVGIIALDKHQWPDELIPAMEVFLKLATPMARQNYEYIYNLDTWFMPCFFARFLKDSGCSVVGNTLTKSIHELINELESGQLPPDYVNDPANYMLSDWQAMQAWHTPWWTQGQPIAGGYPEFYLRHCCGFNDIQLDMQITLSPSPMLFAKDKPVIALATKARTAERNYPFAAKLHTLLEQRGFVVWTGFDGSVDLQTTLQKLQQSDLLITVPSAPQWLAKSVGTQALVLSGNVDPRTLMPDFATPMANTPTSPEAILEMVESIFAVKH